MDGAFVPGAAIRCVRTAAPATGADAGRKPERKPVRRKNESKYFRVIGILNQPKYYIKGSEP